MVELSSSPLSLLIPAHFRVPLPVPFSVCRPVSQGGCLSWEVRSVFRCVPRLRYTHTLSLSLSAGSPHDTARPSPPLEGAWHPSCLPPGAAAGPASRGPGEAARDWGCWGGLANSES
uniref:Uncharacterized protein n=1 Tax=Mus musculus TaxID=10090 RepID=Q3U0Q5_MOUSE|nr:unnamed protein product [Mus musculus]